MLRTCVRNFQSLTLRRKALEVCTVNRGFCEKTTKDETEPNESADNKVEEHKLGGFAKAFERHSEPQREINLTDQKLPDLPFATLLRNSKLIDVSLTNFCCIFRSLY